MYSEGGKKSNNIVLLVIVIQFKVVILFKLCDCILNHSGSIGAVSSRKKCLYEVQGSYFPVDGTILWL